MKQRSSRPYSSTHSILLTYSLVLDPLFHTSAVRKPIVDQQKQWFEYVRLNEKFADAIIEQYQSEQDISMSHRIISASVSRCINARFRNCSLDT